MYKTFLFGLLAALPSSANFTLKAYDFGNGGDTSSSSSYQLQADTGSAASATASGSYALPAGIRASTTVSTPAAPTFTNPDDSYNRLKVTLNVAGFAADTKYLIAISDDNFATTKYVQADQTVGANTDITNYQTYSVWGATSGFWVLGLNNSTTYKVKVAALQGPATGSQFGPDASATTVAPSLSFAVSTSATSTPPLAVSFGSLSPGGVLTADATIITDITTNAANGGTLLLRSQNAGLNSTSATYNLTSATADLGAVSKGYGAQITNASQGSGGPIAAASPYNGSGDAVGGLATSWQQLASFPNPITNANLAVALKAKTDGEVPPATDYSDVVTVSISLLF